ncbi:hypothetical protein [Luteibacter yeojuensis]|uniref:hypothetical protein n=1 Tax=Luteibacter yeojuensis TaxID=345309 RepID=UPI0012EDE203|nr:hypothetical protein [Luteibacter yeojuensis]
MLRLSPSLRLQTGRAHRRSQLGGHLKLEGKVYEKHLLDHGRKWWPIKRFEQAFPRAKVKSSQRRLVVDSLCRTDVKFPDEGIPFTVILTLHDPTGHASVFNELRRTLRSSGARIADIRTAVRVASRT